MPGVSLRPVEDADLDALFDQMRDPESVWMAAFTARDPDDRAAFDAHMASTRPPGTSAVAADPAESPTPGFTYLQFQALLTAARQSPNPCDFALVARPGLLGLRIFEATSADIADLGEEHGHRVLRVCGKGSKVVQVPLPPAVSRAIDRAAGLRDRGPILLNTRGARMDRHAAARRLRRLAQATGLRTKVHPHMLRHTFVTTMLDAGVHASGI